MTRNLILFSSLSSEPISILLVVYSTHLLIKVVLLKTSEKSERFSKKNAQLGADGKQWKFT